MFHFCRLHFSFRAVKFISKPAHTKANKFKKSMKKFVQNPWVLAILFVATAIVSCKKEKLEVISGFSYVVDATDFKKVTFTSAAQNATSISWDFGDGSAASTESNPVHIYASTGTYTVKLNATGADGSDVSSQVITITDPNAELTKLVGSINKNWKLLRVVNANRWPLEVGPIAKDQVWWGLGRGNDDIAKRPCTMNDEWIFGRDGSMQYKSNGDFWAEGGVFDPANICAASTPANMTGPNGTDLSAFGDGTHTFVLTNGTKPTLEVKGLGAFIGLQKIGTDTEVKVPQTSVKLDIIKLTDGAVDTLILESDYKFAAGNPSDEAYWKITLVHYDDPNDEPAVASFAADVVGKVATFTNNSFEGTSYSWNFGDGGTSTETSPSHTYAAGGLYTVVLSVTKGNVTTTFEKQITVSGDMTEADLIGGAWKVRNAANSVFVGPGLGNGDWYKVPANYLDGSSMGVDDWSCMTNDEFIFTAGGKYEYKTNGDARNDGYMGTPNGCWSDAEVAASGNGAAFGSGVHSFSFTPATGTDRPIITLTNGAAGAAFLGFYKGFYGGENGSATNPPNGGNTTNRYEVMSYVNAGGLETLTVSVDISDVHDGSRAWTVVLVR